GRGMRLYLGTIPDYSSEIKDGVLISGTSKGSPAEVAGLQAGDVIIEMGGMKIKNLNDYVYCLQALKANEKTKMRILRAGKERELQITPLSKVQR
ncbi:MAG: PDZ domain-containing protein, partial [Calothrix sp. SM1_5_4]|nr:PDZ domain-containing protein [Calothrix sp. SM1_5_4]